MLENTPDLKTEENQKKRKCPKCECDLFYTSNRAFNNAININKSCQTCSRYGEPKSRKIFGLERICPNCKKLITYQSKICCYKARKKNSVCYICSATFQYNKEKQNTLKLGMIKRRTSYNWSLKTAETRKKNGTYVISEETKEKHRINKVERMIKLAI